MNISNIIAIIALAFSVVSGGISLFNYFTSQKRQCRIDTIEAYRTLQTDVLDKFVSYPKEEVLNLLDNLDEPEFRKAYDDCRAMIAKCEHFAVGVNNKIYDFDTMDKLGGVHLIYLFDKLKPVIDNTRKNQNRNEVLYYSAFEKMVHDLMSLHKECKID